LALGFDPLRARQVSETPVGIAATKAFVVKLRIGAGEQRRANAVEAHASLRAFQSWAAFATISSLTAIAFSLLSVLGPCAPQVEQHTRCGISDRVSTIARALLSPQNGHGFSSSTICLLSVIRVPF
jgi:hypothetical protein